jgi:hypothetical protein
VLVGRVKRPMDYLAPEDLTVEELRVAAAVIELALDRRYRTDLV